MRFSTATVIAFIGMSNALPAPQYGADPVPATTTSCAGDSIPVATTALTFQSSQDAQPTAPVYGSGSAIPETTTIPSAGPSYGDEEQDSDSSAQPSAPATGPSYGDEEQDSDSYIQPSISVGGPTYGDVTPSAPAIPKPSGESNLGSGEEQNIGGGLDLGGLIGGLIGGGKLPGIQIGVGTGLNLEGILGGLTDLLKGSGNLDGSEHVNIGGLLDALKGYLIGLPGGAELGAFCDQLKDALSGSGKVDLGGLVAGLEGLLGGSGKINIGAILGIDVDGLIKGLTLLLEASINGSGGLDIGALLVQFEAFLGGSGHLDLGVGLGLDLDDVIAQLGLLLGSSGSADLDISGLLIALKGFLNGSLDLNGFIAACGKLPGGELLVGLCGKLIVILEGLGIDLNAIFVQLTGVLSGLLKGSLNLGVSLLTKGSLDLTGLLSALVQVSASVGIGGDVSAGASVGVSVGGKIGGLLGAIGGVVDGSSKVVGGLGGLLHSLFKGNN